MSENKKLKINIDKGVLRDSFSTLVKFQNEQKRKSDNILLNENPILTAKLTFNKIPDYSNNYLIRKLYYEMTGAKFDSEQDNGKLDKILSKYPVPIHISHPIYTNTHGSKALLITRDPQRTFKDQQSENKDQIDSNHDIIVKIISFSKLKKRVGGQEDLKKLLNTQDLFLCDSMVQKNLPNLLGQQFYNKKKYPLRVQLNETDSKQLVKEVTDKASSTSVMFSNGSVFSIRLGRLSMTPEEIIDNFTDVIRGLQQICGDDIDIMKIQIEFEGAPTSQVWPSLPVQYNLSKRERDIYNKEKEQQNNLINNE